MKYPVIKKFAAEWERLLKPKIIDPDGWRGIHAQSLETPITFSEFVYRCNQCTRGSCNTLFDKFNENNCKIDEWKEI